jgi:hypothetical protein
MGYWKNGMLEYWVWWNEIYFYIDGTEQKLISDHHPLFTPNIPIFHHSIIPWVIWRQTPPLWGEIKALSRTGYLCRVSQYEQQGTTQHPGKTKLKHIRACN